MYKNRKLHLLIVFLIIGLLIFGVISLYTFMNTAPIELTGDGYTDEYILSINRDLLFIDIVTGLIIASVVSLISTMIYYGFRMYTAPIVTANAILKSKACNVRLAAGKIGYTPYISYTLRFETDSGEDLSFCVDSIRYSLYFEGNKGILKYKEFISRSLIDFYIEEIH